jgi:hypothetical protein
MAKGDMKWIRDNYHVPAKRGAYVLYDGHLAVITSAAAPYLWVRFQSGQRAFVHPTWHMVYVEAGEDG